MTPGEVQLQKAEAQLAETLSRKIDSQRKQAWVVFWLGTFVMVMTVVLPVVGSVAPLVGWGCKEVVIAGVKELLCAEIKPPWGFTAGLLAGIGLYLASAAFRQVEVGEVGKRWLEKLPGMGKKRNGGDK